MTKDDGRSGGDVSDFARVRVPHLDELPGDDKLILVGDAAICRVGEVFPMFELTVDGLTEAARKLMVR